jgi:CMP-N-acetylneuraminic acid synthetase
MRIIGLIPTRRGSKRLPGKNMALLNGKPLLWYAIDAAKRSGIFDEIVVSTDWLQCVTLAENMGVNALLRPPELCTDTAHDYQWVKHALDNYLGFDVFVILRPTSPFRTADTIKRAMEAFKSRPCDSMRAVEKTSAHPLKSWKLWNGEIVPYKEKSINGFPCYDLSTQSLGEVYVQNGCIHVAWVKTLEYGNVSGKTIRPFFTEGREGVDVNNEFDLIFAETLLQKGITLK